MTAEAMNHIIQQLTARAEAAERCVRVLEDRLKRETADKDQLTRWGMAMRDRLERPNKRITPCPHCGKYRHELEAIKGWR